MKTIDKLNKYLNEKIKEYTDHFGDRLQVIEKW